MNGRGIRRAMGKLFSRPKSRHREDRYRVPDKHAPEVDQVKRYPPVHTDAVTSVAAVRHGICVSGSEDQSLAVFNFIDGNCEAKWHGHAKEVTKVDFGSRSDLYFSASRDKQVRVWQMGNRDPSLVINAHDLVVTGLSVNTDNTQLCTGSRDNHLKVWNVTTGALVWQNDVTRNLITHVKWAEGSNVIAQTGEDKELKIWDARHHELSQRFPKKQHIQTCCDLSQDGYYCLTSSNGFSGNGCEATLWDLRMNSLVCEYKGHIETTAACAFVPSSACGGRNLLATSSSDCSVKIWDRDTRECLCSAALPGSGPLAALAVYEDGSLCVSSFNTGLHLLTLRCSPSGMVDIQERAQF